ncbi:MAG: protein translocase subunit SecF [Desulfotomaculum sp.]|nr:protein translocase subunit SecF [Desulfotomaculum sp.]
MVHIIKKRKLWYLISLLVIVPGLISLFTQGLNFGIDFVGGNITEVKIHQDVSVEQVRAVVQKQGLSARFITESGEKNFLIRTEVLTIAQNESFLTAIDEDLGGMTLLRSEKVGPVIGAELAQKAIIALVVASVLMVIYITWRFEFRQGIAAIIAILHDILVVIGIASLLQLEVNTAFVAALLTIIGYSINDTIVIFDRIRENMEIKKGLKLDDLINLSLWQTMPRSINTTLTVLFVLVAMYFLGGVTLKDFMLAMIIGVISGAYSSIFNASPVWYEMLGEKRKKKTVQPVEA